jgi:hypothetical protein
MHSLRILALASLVVAAPSLAIAQGKPKTTHVRPAVSKPSVVRNDAGKLKPDKNALKAEKTLKAEKVLKAEKAEEKAEHSALKIAEADKRLTQGIKLTPEQRKQINDIEKNYHDQFQTLRRDEHTADKTAKKNGTPDDDAAFLAQLATLQANERAALRALLSPAQQAIFDANVVKLDSHK